MNRPAFDRRAFLASAGVAGTTALAGCLDLLGDDSEATFQWIGSGPGARIGQSGTPMEELPDLEGTLTVYSGRHEFLVSGLLDAINDYYDDFEATPRYNSASELVTQIDLEGQGTDADVFFSVNAGSLTALSDLGRTQSLSDDLRDRVPEEFSTEDWIGISGRARSIPYNTEALSSEDLPADIMAYPDLDGYDPGWAPTYSSCQAFVAAMRNLTDDTQTQSWIEGMLANDIAAYPDELRVCEAIAAGEIEYGFTNHYYIQRVLDSNPDAPIATAFTANDAGAIFNVAGAAVVDAADDPTLAENFIRHLLSAEAQAYFAVETFEYPLAPDVDPIGELPPITDLEVPEIDYAWLSELSETIELMRDAGVAI